MVKVIVPVDVTGGQLIANNVAEDDGPEWDVGTTYAAFDRVIKASTHRVYESSRGNNLGNDPEGAEVSDWLEVGATNGHRAFDNRLSAPSSKAGAIEFTVQPDTLVRAVALVGASAASATVRVKDPNGVTLVERVKDLADYSAMIDAITMVTVAPDFRNVVVFEDIICTPGNLVEIVIGDGAGTAEISEVVLGDVLTIGTALYGAEVGIEDFSTFEEDRFGGVDITKRAYRDWTEFPIAVSTADIGRLRRTLASIRAKFALYYFTADGNDYGTTVYGRYESLSTVISGPITSDMSLKILGATYDA